MYNTHTKILGGVDMPLHPPENMPLMENGFFTTGYTTAFENPLNFFIFYPQLLQK